VTSGYRRPIPFEPTTMQFRPTPTRNESTQTSYSTSECVTIDFLCSYCTSSECSVCSNRENELIPVLCCDTDSTDEKVHSRLTFVTVHRPETVSAEGYSALASQH